MCAVVSPTAVAGSVRTSSAWKPCASSRFGDPLASVRKKGVPTVPAGGVCPSAVNGSDVLLDEIGERPEAGSGAVASTWNEVRLAKGPGGTLSPPRPGTDGGFPREVVSGAPAAAPAGGDRVPAL